MIQYPYVCVYVCMPACMHACMYVYVLVCGCICMHVCMYACMPACMYACIYVCPYACMYVCMYVSMCVCMCLYVCVSLCMHVCPVQSVCVYARMSVCMHVCVYVCMYVRPPPRAIVCPSVYPPTQHSHNTRTHACHVSHTAQCVQTCEILFSCTVVHGVPPHCNFPKTHHLPQSPCCTLCSQCSDRPYDLCVYLPFASLSVIP